MSIGIYDSGLGGLSVWRELTHLDLPLVYFGDTAHMPYGDKTPEQLESYFWDALSFFAEQGCTGVVVACNTTSSLVLPKVKSRIQMPVLGIIEAAVGGVLAEAKGTVGILATKGTVESGVYQQALKTARPDWRIVAQAAPRLVPLVERGEIKGKKAEEAVAEYLQPLLEAGIDTLLLGCTHYPFLRALIEKFTAGRVKIVDPSPLLAAEVQAGLAEFYSGSGNGMESELWVSAAPEQFHLIAQELLELSLPQIRLRRPWGEKT